jgi:two-component system response regulator AtoC
MSEIHFMALPAEELNRVFPGDWRRDVEPLLVQIAASDMPVLVQGETGAGKEVIARKIHEDSSRRAMPFIKINCAALPSELIESELFGYEKGAFTGAFKTTPGKFALANHGTVFLDEIGDMDFKLQGKLLQVLQDHEYLPLGGREVQKVDVRVIAATHRDLRSDVENGRFREDLYYRLDVINICVPPLRDRKAEVLPLARFFLEKHGFPTTPPLPIPPQLAQGLLSHDWPGNVRELENLMKRYIVFGDPEAIRQHILGRIKVGPQRAMKIAERPSTAPEAHWASPPASVSNALNELKRSGESEEAKFILGVLESTRWNRKKAAQLLNMEYKALLYRMKKLGIDNERLNASKAAS